MANEKTQTQTQDDFHYDTRMILRNIRNGVYKQVDIEKHLATLPDLADQYVEINAKIFGDSNAGLALSGEFHSGDADE